MSTTSATWHLHYSDGDDLRTQPITVQTDAAAPPVVRATTNSDGHLVEVHVAGKTGPVATVATDRFIALLSVAP